tara:strand:- start:11 stop:316 length:306 start_codon:yes stop_codon:yes gene_type:complete
MSKTLTFNDTGRSPYLFDDSKNVTMGADKITVGDEADPDFYIGDMNSGNATLHEGVTGPEDWQGNRYTFDGTDWTEVDGWVDPKEAEIARLQAQIDALQAE